MFCGDSEATRLAWKPNKVARLDEHTRNSSASKRHSAQGRTVPLTEERIFKLLANNQLTCGDVNALIKIKKSLHWNDKYDLKKESSDWLESQPEKAERKMERWSKRMETAREENQTQNKEIPHIAHLNLS